jgi:sec-independent protein translocase protein TatB
MFDFAWTEIALIAAVALIAIGPKDLPVAIKAITEMIKKARRMAGEFQTHVDDLVREANLDEVRSQINEIRNFDIKGTVERAVDPDGSLRSTIASNPLSPSSYDPPKPSEAAIGEHAQTSIETPGDVDVLPRPDEPVVEAEEPAPVVPAIPAWVPPALAPAPPPAPTVVVTDAPAFIPPAYATKHPKP